MIEGDSDESSRVCRVVKKGDESLRVAESLQRVTLTSHQGCTKSSTEGDESSRVAES